MNLGFIRQYLGEVPPDRTFTAKELWEVFNTFAPLMTKEQEKEIVEAIKEMTNQPIEEKWKEGMWEGAMSQVFCRLHDSEVKILESFIENLLEQERERMSDEVSNLDGVRGLDVDAVSRFSVLSIINK